MIRFAEAGVIEIRKRRDITVLDADRLGALAAGDLNLVSVRRRYLSWES